MQNNIDDEKKTINVVWDLIARLLLSIIKEFYAKICFQFLCSLANPMPVNNKIPCSLLFYDKKYIKLFSLYFFTYIWYLFLIILRQITHYCVILRNKETFLQDSEVYASELLENLEEMFLCYLYK